MILFGLDSSMAAPLFCGAFPLVEIKAGTFNTASSTGEIKEIGAAATAGPAKFLSRLHLLTDNIDGIPVEVVCNV